MHHCIFSAPRSGSGAFTRGKNLHEHEQDELLQPVSILSAEEFLELRGLMLAAYPEQKGSQGLQFYGYSITEDF